LGQLLPADSGLYFTAGDGSDNHPKVDRTIRRSFTVAGAQCSAPARQHEFLLRVQRVQLPGSHQR